MWPVLGRSDGRTHHEPAIDHCGDERWLLPFNLVVVVARWVVVVAILLQYQQLVGGGESWLMSLLGSGYGCRTLHFSAVPAVPYCCSPTPDGSLADLSGCNRLLLPAIVVYPQLN
jgi:hypothetical protein